MRFISSIPGSCVFDSSLAAKGFGRTSLLRVDWLGKLHRRDRLEGKEARNCLHFRGRAHRPLVKVNALSHLRSLTAASCMRHTFELPSANWLSALPLLAQTGSHTRSAFSLSGHLVRGADRTNRRIRTNRTHYTIGRQRQTDRPLAPGFAERLFAPHTSDCTRSLSRAA